MNALEALKHYFGYSGFRPGQDEVISAVLQGRDVLGIMPTGAGKSLCYQIPALLFPGVTLVISPLISLMKDQVMALKASGVPCAFLNSTLTDRQLDLAMARAVQGAYKIIYVAPERLHTASFQRMTQNLTISLIAVDEAHCVSQWGHEFRPEYRRIRDFLDSLPQRPHYCAFTATATEHVKKDIIELLGLRDPFLKITGFDRPELHFEVIEPVHPDPALVYILRAMNGRSGIVYCMSRKNVENVCEMLCSKGFSATRYHAGLSEDERKKNQEDFQYDRVSIMVATNAFGMGIDKSNVRFVIHYNLPLSLEAYYQEAGRAGRDGLPADCILLFNRQDVHLGNFLLERSSENSDLSEDDRAAVRTASLERFREMQSYCKTRSCLRNFILRYFGDTATSRCSACSNCTGTRFPRLDQKRSTSKIVRSQAQRPLPLSPVLRPEIKKAAPAAPHPAAFVPKPGTLLEKLYDQRAALAQSAGLPPYIICPDSALQDIVRKMPGDTETMALVDGMGFAKAHSYATSFLQAMEAFFEEHPEADDGPWTDEEISQLRVMDLSGQSLLDISERLGRSPFFVRRKIHSLVHDKAAGTFLHGPGTMVARKSASQGHARIWQSKEVNWLRKLHDLHWTVHRMAIQLGRKDMEIVEKLRELGLTPKYDTFSDFDDGQE